MALAAALGAALACSKTANPPLNLPPLRTDSVLAPEQTAPGRPSSSESHSSKGGREGPDLVAPPPETSLPVGSAGAGWAEVASPAGNWVVLCQARQDTNGDGVVAVVPTPDGRLQGDAATAYLVLGSGPGEPIEAWLGHSADGRWLVTQTDGQVELLDTFGKDRVDLSARRIDARADSLSHASHRAIAFAPGGERMAFIRREGRSEGVVLLDLESGHETPVPVGPGRPWRIEFAGDGGALRVWVVAEDKNGNGRLDWPVAEQRSPAGCQRALRYGAWLDHGDPASLQIVRLGAKGPRPPREALATWGAGLLRRTQGGALEWAKGTRRRRLTDEDCGGTLMHVDSGRELALVACSAVGVRVPVWLVGPTFRRELPIQVLASRVDYVSGKPQRLVPLYPGADAVLVDMERRELVILQQGDGVLGVLGALALVRRGTSLLLLDTEDGTTKELAADLPDFGQILEESPFVYAEPYLVDLAQRTVVGSTWGPIAALSSRGAILMASAPETANSLAEGPFFWIPREQ